MPRRPGRDLSVGALATMALGILAVAVMAVGGQSRVFSRKVHYRVVFLQTEGLRVGSPVKMAGVQLGAVTDVHLPTDPNQAGIVAELGVETAYKERVRVGSKATLRYLQWLSGEKYVEITPGEPAGAPLPDDSEIPTVEEMQFLEKGADIADNLSEITVALKTILEPLQKGEGLLGQAIHDPEFGKESLAHLKETLANLESLTRRLNAGEGFAGRVLFDSGLAGRVDELAGAISRLADFVAVLHRREGAVGALTEKGGAGEQAITELRDAAASLKRTAVRLESTEGLLGRLLNDREYSEQVASDLRSTLHDLSEITAKINAGQGTLGALVNERTLHDGAEDVIAGVGDSKFARWLMRHYQKKGIEGAKPPASP